jgi:hypothetical protein
MGQMGQMGRIEWLGIASTTRKSACVAIGLRGVSKPRSLRRAIEQYGGHQPLMDRGTVF